MNAYDKVTDIAFPFIFSGESGKLKTLSIEDDVKQSLFLLISTEKGERLNRPDYGCSLERFAFESVNYSLISSIRNEVLAAADIYEKRAEILGVSVAEDDGEKSAGMGTEALVIKINYRIKGTAMEQTLDYKLSERLK